MEKAEREMQELEQRQADEAAALRAELVSLQQRLALTKRTPVLELKTAQRRLKDEADRYKQAIEA